MKRTTLSKFLLLLISIVAILMFSSIPIWLGRSAQPESLTFRGTYTDTQDYAVHLSMMQAGRMGEWTYQLRFTSEEHQPAFIRLFYVFLGHFSRWLNIDVETVFHLARWVFGLTALVVIFQLFQKLFTDQTWAWSGFFLAVLGSGSGWLQLLLGAPLEPIAPIDFWLIDAYTLFSISLFPSFSFTLTLMVAALLIFLDYLETEKWSRIAAICILAIIAQGVNPIAFAVIDIAMAVTLFITWWKQRKINLKQAGALGVIAAVQVPLFFYNLIILTRDPIWSQFTSQNETLSPPLMFYGWGFLPFWIFAIFGLYQAMRERNIYLTALIAWGIAGFMLAYAPVAIQRRFLLGITIPLAALAIHGLQFLINSLPTSFAFLIKRKRLIAFTYILLASLSTFFLFLNSSMYTLSQPDNLYYPRDLANAIQWLDENTAANEFVLAAVDTSQVIAQRSDLKVYVGHEMETLHFYNKESLMQAYYRGTIADEWLSQTPVKWVVYGPNEMEINSTFSPTPFLEPVFQNDTVIIYRVLQ